ncbi:flavin reductase family protein [Streptomyces sp. NL15-2K]|uniref:flavin reductase family protein n=1 Tax=Streptomyces sp. NL15-2K TaxID=376149 RepID=UPI000F5846C3|nr:MULTISPECIES: flavin reductase family protein [Actinomycetes]WKX12275.1 flavin reductase family protein [Kutzneria buriramensis]GCB46225.1 NADH-FMN oxidoreductase [Streptomyces sp. NL15-2K]
MAAATSDRPVDSRPDSAFLDAMAALAGGVCVVTALTAKGRPVGFTSTAVMSLSREPQLLAIGVGRRGRTLPTLLGGRTFALNILHAGGEHISRRFADSSADRFAEVEWSAEERGGLPLLLAHSSYAVLCRIARDLPAGDHQLIVAAVEGVVTGTGGPTALVHHDRRYHALGAA